MPTRPTLHVQHVSEPYPPECADRASGTETVHEPLLAARCDVTPSSVPSKPSSATTPGGGGANAVCRGGGGGGGSN